MKADKNGSDSSFILILGASTRAAAFSALRAGLRPCCVDLFADADLQARCVVQRIPSKDYPRGLLQAVHDRPPVPWMYTGAMENHPSLVDAISAERPLWGNPGKVLRRIRSPAILEATLRAANVPCPAVRLPGQDVPSDRRWLIKRRASAGGTGISSWDGNTNLGRLSRRVYLQEYIEGKSCAAIFVSVDRQARFLGMTRQLVGETWLNARPFHYCGSIGSLEIASSLRQVLQRLGDVLVDRFDLRGIFGVDCILRDNVPWPVEVNPRYTASVEVLEYAQNRSLLPVTWRAGGVSPLIDADIRGLTPPARQEKNRFVGKAILFARASLIFPEDGPWQDVLRSPTPVEEVPAFTDIPQAGERIEAGRPILTLFAQENSEDACFKQLQQVAANLDHRLFDT